MSKKNLLWIAAPFVIVCVCVCGFLVGLSEYRLQILARNEQSAEMALRTLRTAQMHFFTNDTDRNGVQDYWTADLAGLWKYNLLERSVLEADARPLAPLVSKPVPKNGYLFVALLQDDSEKPPEVYCQDTDSKSGKVHHRAKYGFCAFPAQPGVTGRFIFIINEWGMRRRHVEAGSVPTSWPKDSEHITWSSCWSG